MNTSENPERTIALLGVATHQQNSKAGTCPTDEQLVAFITKGKQRQTMLAHLNRCPKCYHHWLETASYIKSLEPEKSYFLKKWDFFRDVFQLDNWKPLALTAVLVVAVLVWFPKSPIDASYVAVTAHNPDGYSEVLENLPLETTTLGFYDIESSPPAQAFSAGIETGQAILTNTTPSDEMAAWADTQWAEEYTLGRWFVLLWTVAQTPNQAPTDFWTQQPAIGEKLQARFNKRSPDEMTETVLETLANIQPLLTELKNQPKNRRLVYQLNEYLEMAINGISDL
jgi:hypothetical protein